MENTISDIIQVVFLENYEKKKYKSCQQQVKFLLIGNKLFI